MSKETTKMHELRIQRIALKRALRFSEAVVKANKVNIGKLWPTRDTKHEDFKAIKKLERATSKEKERLRTYRFMLRSAKDEIRHLNRQHDYHMMAMRGEK